MPVNQSMPLPERSRPASRPLYALVVEGGGMRGGFSAGVLDAFLENEFDPFSIYGGVSGGAMNLSSFLSKQHGRNFRIYRDICTSANFISFGKYVRGGHWIDLDWLWKMMATEEPFDIDGACNNIQGKQVYFAATRVEDGSAEYFSPTKDLWMDYLKASSALPVLYRRFVDIGGKAYTDGGVADPLPSLRAEILGADVTVVIRSRPLDYRIHSKLAYYAAAAWHWRYPQLRKSLLDHAQVYNRQVTALAERAKRGSVISIAPLSPTASERDAVSRSSIESDYRRGRETGQVFLTNFLAGANQP